MEHQPLLLSLHRWIAGIADWRLLLGIALSVVLVWEQVTYARRGRHLPGPAFVLPFLGSVFGMVNDPATFWDLQAEAAKKVGLSWNVLFGRFVLFVRDSEMSQRIFANVKPDVFQLVGHPFGKKIFGQDNLIFMFGEEHKDLRRRLAPLFTLKALGVYVEIQERTIRQHIDRWIETARQTGGAPIQLRNLCRDLNLETSQNVFVGPYLSPEARKQFYKDYNDFNVGLMCLPVALPGFAFYRATQAVPRLIETLADCARQSKERMKQGAEPACLVDFWMAETVREVQEAGAAGQPPPPHSSDAEIGQHIFDFLFAAQDASTSSLAWAVALMGSHPEVLAKVREEVKHNLNDCPSPSTPSFTPELLRGLKYTEMVVKEVLRFRPPATMVPHAAINDFQLTDTYTVRKGTIVFPSVFESSFQGFTDPYTFDPDRFSPERQEDVVFKRNWLMFGAGPHQCLGQRYAINHLMLFTALFASLVHWTRVRSAGCDNFVYTPTIAPKDGCLISISKLEQTAGAERVC